jgi:hypothetical protein
MLIIEWRAAWVVMMPMLLGTVFLWAATARARIVALGSNHRGAVG